MQKHSKDSVDSLSIKINRRKEKAKNTCLNAAIEFKELAVSYLNAEIEIQRLVHLPHSAFGFTP